MMYSAFWQLCNITICEGLSALISILLSTACGNTIAIPSIVSELLHFSLLVPEIGFDFPSSLSESVSLSQIILADCDLFCWLVGCIVVDNVVVPTFISR